MAFRTGSPSPGARPVPAVCLSLALGTEATGGPLADLVDMARPTGATTGTRDGKEEFSSERMRYDKTINHFFFNKIKMLSFFLKCYGTLR